MKNENEKNKEKNNEIKAKIKNNEYNFYETYENDFIIIDNKSFINDNSNNIIKNKKQDKNNDDNPKNIDNKYDFNNIKNANILSFEAEENKNSYNNDNNKNNNNNIDTQNNDKNNNDNIQEGINISNTFKKNFGKKEACDIFDFENIELPKESQNGDFTEINCPYILENKKEAQENKEKNNPNKILLNIYNSMLNPFTNTINNYSRVLNNNSEVNLDSDKLFKTCINLESKKKEVEIIKIMAVLKSTKNQTWKDNIKSLVSSIYYNAYGIFNKFDKEDLDPDLNLYIFDTQYDNNKNELNLLLKSYLYMSYRSGFINLNSIGGGDYTSDCGWGCMLRCCQMILSKGLIQKKINEFLQKKYSILDYDSIDKIRRQILDLFNDNYLPSKEIKNHPDYKLFWEKFEKLTKTNSEYSSISEIIPPYSIHILSKIGKCAGEYTSDLKIIKLMAKINSQIFNDMNILIFECGYISRKKLIMNFCEEYTDFNSNYLETITYNGVDYILKKVELFLFLSV